MECSIEEYTHEFYNLMVRVGYSVTTQQLGIEIAHDKTDLIIHLVLNMHNSTH